MKILTLITLLMVACHLEAIPTFLPGARNWGVGLNGPIGPGWGGGIGGIYPGVSVYSSGYGTASLPSYAGSYSYSPSYPGYIPGLYGQGYLNLRG